MTGDDGKILPFHPSPESDDISPRVLDLTGEDADLVFDALSSTTARRILATLHNKPTPPSEIAETLDLSLQNVHYHLRNMRDADLIEEIETGYSEKGVEVSIYAPTANPVVISEGKSDEQVRLRKLLKQIGGVIPLFGLLSILAHWAVTRKMSIETPAPSTPNPVPTPGAVETPAPATPNPTPAPVAIGTPAPATPNPTPTPRTVGTPMPSPPNPTPVPGAVESGSFIPPGLMFFIGGIVMFLMIFVWWYYRDIRNRMDEYY